MSQSKLQVAKEFLEEKQYYIAKVILETLKDSPTAIEWLEKLNKIQPQIFLAEQVAPRWEYSEIFWDISSFIQADYEDGNYAYSDREPPPLDVLKAVVHGFSLSLVNGLPKTRSNEVRC